MNDFCIILIGENDFNVSQNYSELVSQIRNILVPIDYTNIIICVPTFNYSPYAHILNKRVDFFNTLFYKDVQKHEYAYLLDSNLELTYDYKMFSKSRGVLNNYGMKNIISNLSELITNINTCNFPNANEKYFFRW